jgi:hypothetical protein
VHLRSTRTRGTAAEGKSHRLTVPSSAFREGFFDVVAADLFHYLCCTKCLLIQSVQLDLRSARQWLVARAVTSRPKTKNGCALACVKHDKKVAAHRSDTDRMLAVLGEAMDADWRERKRMHGETATARTWYLTSYFTGSFRKYWNCSMKSRIRMYRT